MADSSGVKPKLQIAIEHLDAAHDHMGQAMTILSSIILDLQKGADYILRYRDSFLSTIETMAGAMDAAQNVESQMRDFIPKNYRAPESQDHEEAARVGG